MSSSKAGYWLQVAANIAILGGLIMVGLQINQNSELTRLAFYSDEETDAIAIHGTQAGETVAEAWAKAIDYPESLTTAEMVQLDGFLDSQLEQFQRRQYLFEEGVFQISGEETIPWIVKQHFGNTFAKAWWQEKRRHDDYSPLIREAVDREIAAVSASADKIFFDNIRQTIQTRSHTAARTGK